MSNPFSGTGAIGGRAFHDENNDGERDEFDDGINGIPNVDVSLYECEEPDAKLATTRTNTNGFYSFVNLRRGTYFIRAELPEAMEGYRFSDVWDSGGGGSGGAPQPRLFAGDYENVSRDDGRMNRLFASGSQNRVRRRRRLGTGGGPVANDGEKSTIDPETGRTVICINLEEGEQSLQWGFGLFRPSEGPSGRPSSSYAPTSAPTRVISDGPSALSSDVPSMMMSNSPSHWPSGSPTSFIEPTSSPSSTILQSSSPVAPALPADPTLSPSRPADSTSSPSNPPTPTTVAVIMTKESNAPSMTPSAIRGGTNLLGGNQLESGPSENSPIPGAIKNGNGETTQEGNSSSNNNNMIIGITWGVAALFLLAAALLLYRWKKPKDDGVTPPSVVHLKRRTSGDDISEMHMSRSDLLAFGLNSRGAGASSGRGGGASRRASSSPSSRNSNSRNSGEPTRSPPHSVSSSSGGSLAALSDIIERSSSAGSKSGDEDLPPTSRTSSHPPSDWEPLPLLPRYSGKHITSLSDDGKWLSRRHSEKYKSSLSDDGIRFSQKIKLPSQLRRSKDRVKALSRSLPGDVSQGRPLPPKGRRRKTVHGLEREVASLSDAIRSFPENSQTWLLLNSYRKRAREELEEVRNGVGDGQPRPGAVGASSAADDGTSCIVCCMAISLDDVPGRQYYTGQIDMKSRLPHGLGTLRTEVDDDGAATMLEGRWRQGEFVREVRTSDGGVNEIGFRTEAEAAGKPRESGVHGGTVQALTVNSWNQAATVTASALQDSIKTKEAATDVSSRDNLEESGAGEETGRAASPVASSFSVAAATAAAPLDNEEIADIPSSGNLQENKMDGEMSWSAHSPVAATLPAAASAAAAVTILDSTKLMEIDSSIDETNNTADLAAPTIRAPAAEPSHSPRRLSSSTSKETIEITAPPGTLGLVMDKNDRGAVYVRSMQPTSPLIDQVQLNDEIVAVDGLDVRRMAPLEIGYLLSSKKTKPRRTISILRCTSIVVETCDTVAERPKAADVPSSDEGSVGSDDTSRTSPSSSVAAHSKTAASIVHSSSSFVSHPDIDKIYRDMIFRFQECESPSISTVESDSVRFDDGTEENSLLSPMQRSDSYESLADVPDMDSKIESTIPAPSIADSAEQNEGRVETEPPSSL